MTAQNSTQSQPSYFKTIEQKPNYQAITPKQLVDQLSATHAMNKLAAVMAVEDGHKFQQCLQSLNVLFEKGYSYLMTTHTIILRKMMNHFTKLGKQLQDDTQNSKIQIRMLYVLSVIAELLRNNPKYYYPFTRKFLMTVFTIDAQLLCTSKIKDQILAILSVIYENLSRQPKLVTKYAIQSNVKYAILGNYAYIDQVITLKIMNKAISNLVSKGINFSVADFHKYKVMETVTKIISKSQLDLFLIKMKMTMISCSSTKTPVYAPQMNTNSAQKTQTEMS